MKKNPHELGLGTLVTHFTEKDNPHQAHIAPIYQTSTFVFPDVQTGADIFAGKNKGFSYTRADNPNARQLAKKLAAHNFMKKVAPLYGINVVCVEGSDMESWQVTFEQHPETAVAYFEPPANQNMEIVDIAQVSALAQENNTWTIIDNTLATPYCQRPLSLGADIVIHSTTKYLGGHGTIIGGAVISRHPHFFHPTEERFFLSAKVFGGCPSPFDTWLTNIGLKTFELRMQRHIENAAIVAEWLQKHPIVSKVYYPGLENFPGHQTARKQMFNGFGGMLSFELTGDYKAGVSLMQSLKLISLAVSLGNVDSLIQHPASMTHAAMSPEDRLEFGITDSLIRFSVGIENIGDVLADLDQALDQAGD